MLTVIVGAAAGGDSRVPGSNAPRDPGIGDSRVLARATSGSAGYDLAAAAPVTVPAGGQALVSTGLALEIPEGHAGLVCSRSGLALRERLTVANSPGVIDSDYRGEVGVILRNDGEVDYEVVAGQRVAQIVFIALAPVIVVAADAPDAVDGAGASSDGGGSDPATRAGGFGSTGL